MYLDLDQFKVINDTCGHQAGDRLLKQITGVVQTRIRTTDTLARLGGDEFGVLLQDCTLDTAERIAENLRQAIRDFRFVWHERVMNVGVSIGLAEINAAVRNAGLGHERRRRRLLFGQGRRPQPRADLRQGRAPERHREMQWVSRINRACEENRLDAALPADRADPRRRRARCGTSNCCCACRTRAAQLVQPAEFIPAAERYNLMPAIDRWVVRRACSQLAHRRSDAGAPPAVHALDQHLATTLNDEQFLDFVITEMAAVDLSPGALCFELTEAAAMGSLASATRFINELRARGCRFALDDFGSGLSSFMFLRTLPVDYLKIDGQFVQNVTHDQIDRSMVEAIAQIGQTMGIRTIAEKVDSPDVLARLAEIGVQYAQGNYIAPPRPVDLLADLVNAEPGVIKLTA